MRLVPRDFFNSHREIEVPLLRSGFPEADALYLSIFHQPPKFRVVRHTARELKIERGLGIGGRKLTKKAAGKSAAFFCGEYGLDIVTH